MASLEDVERLVAELPETVETERYGNRTWTTNGKAFAWERPFSKARSEALRRRDPAGRPNPGDSGRGPR